jgi:hypothetical protein
MTTPPVSDTFRQTLRTWRVTPPINPNFRAETWDRIETVRRDRVAGWLGYLRFHAASCAIVFAAAVAVAGLAGNLAGRAHNALERDAMLATYVTAIDARAMATAMSGAAAN